MSKGKNASKKVVNHCYRLYRIKPRVSRCKGASNKLWYA